VNKNREGFPPPPLLFQSCPNLLLSIFPRCRVVTVRILFKHFHVRRVPSSSPVALIDISPVQFRPSHRLFCVTALRSTSSKLRVCALLLFPPLFQPPFPPLPFPPKSSPIRCPLFSLFCGLSFLLSSLRVLSVDRSTSTSVNSNP